uniref:CUB domain-containing protein n=1 Tax=Strongyloides stercoralis TaxID=6248 RepID=A0A0K0EAC7_STRER
MSTFQCPNGYFISKFSSVFDGSERFYKFSCTKFSKEVILYDEVCSTTEAETTEEDDMYLSCGSDQYTVGVELIENVNPGVNSWQLLCCKSSQIIIRNDDCIDTKFINDYKRSSSFSSGTQIIRKWQSMGENNDRRWWLQLCPIDIFPLKKDNLHNDVRARRQVPLDWSRGRFPVTVSDYNPLFMDQDNLHESQRRKMFKINQEINHEINKENVLIFSREGLQTTSSPINDILPQMPIRLRHYNPKNTNLNRLNILPKSTEKPYTSVTKTSTLPTITTTRVTATTTTRERTTSIQYSNLPEKPTDALDYYDMYDDNFDKKKHLEKHNNGILSAVSDIFQNLQDSLSLAQYAIPQDKFKLILPEPAQPIIPTNYNGPPIRYNKPTPGNNEFLFSTDNDAFKLHINSDVKKVGPLPNIPNGIEKNLQKNNDNGQGPIDSILQTLGLCQGHR